jgi:adenylate cyclase
LDASEANAYFGVGLTQELVASIAAFEELRVLDVPPMVEGDSVAHLAPRLARDADVRFVLSGTFRKDDNSIVLRVQLTEAPTAEVIWTEKIRRDLSASQLLDLEEDIARHVARSVAENYGVIPRKMADDTHRKRTDELSVYDAVLRFRHYQCVVTNDARDRAIDALERAIQFDPHYTLCWAMLSEAVCDAYGLRIDYQAEVLTRAKELARRAISLDPSCQHAHWALAYAHFHARERDAFLKSAESTIELNPNNGYLVGISAWAMALVGEWERGLSILKRLMEQNPYYPTWMHLAPYLNHYRKGEFDAALDHANKFNIPDLAWDPILRAAALANVGRPEEAEAALKQFTSTFPVAAADPAHYLRGYIFLDDLVDEVVDGLRKAGWSGSEPTVSSAVE